MIEINWNNFKSKFNGKERGSFESLAYMLFCHEYNIKIGIFRFKNQTGIETEPILHDGIYVGFQAKYFDSQIDKQEIIESITKAKNKNPSLQKILLYLNLELSESSRKSKKKAIPQEEIEKAASELQVILEWRVPSHFELQLSVPENDYLADYFFSLSNGAVAFLDRMKFHSQNILGPIQTSIEFERQEIKIDRSEIVSELGHSSDQIVIVAGDGGSGKTALIKDYIFAKATPSYLLKAAEFARQSLNEVFQQFGPYDVADFLRFHEEESSKVFVIDSSERLADLSDVDVFKEFLTALLNDGWKVFFTTRNSYLNDLCFQMQSIYRRSFNIIRLENITIENLTSLSSLFKFELPSDLRLRRLLCNLFYLNEYLINYGRIEGAIGVAGFRSILWQRKVQNTQYRKNNLHVEREQCFLNLAEERCTTGNFLLKGGGCRSEVLALLETDEVIKSEPDQSAYFIAHDIYEEWALEKLIEREFASLLSCQSFFINIGASLPMRRAFRSWLSEKLFQEAADIKHFADDAFNSDLVPQLWKDEILVSVLLSDYCTTFFEMLGNLLLDNSKTLLFRIIFLLRTACKEVDTELQKLIALSGDSLSSSEHVFTKPKGKGWEVVIAYLKTNVDQFEKDDLIIILPFLTEWVAHCRKGVSTRTAGLIALHFYRDSEQNDDVYYGKETEESLLHLVLAAAIELKPELVELADHILRAPDDERQPFESLRDAVLTDSDSSFHFIATMPELTLKIAESAWCEREERSQLYFSGTGLEEYYAIARHWHHDYFPASAYQTPIYHLLRCAFRQTVDFIVDFTNRSVESYFKSGWDESLREVDVVIGTKQTKQIISSGLWAMYRGSGSPVTPYLLQSIHMALEKRLLEVAKLSDKSLVEKWLLYLLENTRSASITAVVASVVLAYPDDLFSVAKTLFGNYEFFKCDNHRLVLEHQARGIYSIGGGLDYRTKKYDDERLATCEESHRSMSLENLALKYQFFKGEIVTEQQVQDRQNTIWGIIDGFYATIPDASTNDEHIKLRLLLARIDRRKMSPTVEANNDQVIIHFNPELAKDLEARSQQAQDTHDTREKYIKLKLWSVDKLENRSRSNLYNEYDGNAELILTTVKEILKGLQDGDESFYLFDTVPAFACSALVKNYSDEISKADLLFCGEFIQEFATSHLRENYGYQISDGVEAAISALPAMYRHFPEARQNFNLILLLTLLDNYPLGAYKRICDYSIEALHTLFDLSPDDANAVVFGYMRLAPIFEIENNQRRLQLERKSRAEILGEFISKHEADLDNMSAVSDYYQSIEFETQNARVAETVFQIIPAATEDVRHLDYIRKTLTRFSGMLLTDTGYKEKKEIDHRLKRRFFKKYASFLLHRDVKSVVDWTAPFIDVFRETEETSSLISEIVSAEDVLAKYDVFWKTWDCFYPAIKGMAKTSRDRDLNTIITNYLLAWPWWNDAAKEWRSLREREKVFFKKVSIEMGQHPAVLYSIGKLLNEIGAPFLDEGILWIADMLTTYKNLHSEELLPNTVYYLEKAARKYVYLNRSKLKRSRVLADRLTALLDFLVSKGSVNGYLLREDVF